MELKELFLAQLERETAASRKAVERVPEDRAGWKPHDKSMPMGHLASLVASMPGWIAFMIETDEIHLDRPSSDEFRTKPVGSKAELLRTLDDAVQKARKALENTTEEHLMKPWRFVMGGRVLSEQPRHVCLTDSVFSHLAHHRGQLTVYLRLNEARVPAIYGPSADEGL